MNTIRHTYLFALIVVIAGWNNNANAQCTSSSANSVTSQSATNTGASLTLNLKKLNDDYEQVTGLVVGMSYLVSSTTSTAYFTVNTGSETATGTVITSGTQPLTFTATATTVYIIINTNSSCGTNNTGSNPTNTLIAAPSINSIPSSGCIGSSITITGNGGFTGATGVSFNGTAATTFNVASSTSITATIPSGATTGTISVTGPGGTGISSSSITVNSLPGDNSGANQTICNGVSIGIGASNVGGDTYSWSPAGTLTSSTISNPTASPTTTTTYTLIETTTLTACSVSNTTVVTVNTVPVATATHNSQSICSGSSFTTMALSTSNSVTGTTFAWTRDNAANVTGATSGSGSSITGAALTNSTTSPVTVTYTITPTGPTTTFCVGNPITATVLVNPIPVGSATAQTICSGSPSSVLLNSTATSTTFTWTNSLQSGNISGATSCSSSCGTSIAQTLTSTSTGVEKYTVTPSVNGCPGTAFTVNVTVNPVPVATATNNSQSICSGNSFTTMTLSTSNSVTGTTFAWTRDNAVNVTGATSGSGSSITGAALTNNTTSPVTVTYTITPTGPTPSFCPGNPITATVTVNPIPSGSATAQTICSGSPSSVALSSTVSGTTFTWTNSLVSGSISGATSCSSSCGTSIAQTLSTTSTGGVEGYIVTPSANSCPGSAFTVDITVDPIPADNSGANGAICNNGSSIGIGASNVTGDTYSWSPAGTLTSSTISNPSASPTTTTTYTLIESTTLTGCSASNTTVVTVNTVPVATATNNSQAICSGNPFTTMALSTSNGVTGTTFAWTRDNAATVTGATSGSGSSITGGALTNSTTSPVTVTYSITPTGPTSTFCVGNTITATVTVNPIPSGSATGQTICSGNPSSVALSSTVTGTTFTWTNALLSGNISGATSCSSSCGSSIAQTLTSTSTGVEKYTVTPSANSCPGTAFTVSVTVNPVPVATATNNSQSICSGNPFTTMTLSTSNSVTGTTFAWTRDNAANVTGATSGSGSSITGAALTNNTTSPVTVTYTITPTGPTPSFCPGNPITATVTVNPIPSGSATAQTICSGSPSSVALSSTVSGTTFTWTNSLVSGSISGATSCSSSCGTSIAQTLTTTSTGVEKYTVTPLANTCPGSAFTVNITVDPIPADNSGANEAICNNGSSIGIGASNVTGDTYSWSPAGTLTSSTISNPTANPTTTTTYTLIESTTLTGCSASNTTVVTVNTVPVATAINSSQTICNGTSFTTMALSTSNSVTGTTFTWTRDNASNVTGATSGSGSSITGAALTDNTTSPVTVTYTITPTGPTPTFCIGNNITATVTVYPASAATNYFRSQATGNWNAAATWQSSYDSVQWCTSTLVPTNIAQSITIQSGNTVTVTAAATASTVVINSGGTLAISGSNTLSVNGDWINNGTFTANSSTVTFNGSANEAIGGTVATTFDNLAISENTSTDTITSTNLPQHGVNSLGYPIGGYAFQVAGNLNVTQGNLILQATNANYAVTGTVTVPAAGTLTHSVKWDSTGFALVVSGSIAVDGLLTHTVRSTIIMNGAGTSVRSGNTPGSAFDIFLIENSSGTISASGTVIANDNFWSSIGVSGGTFSTNGQSVTANVGLFNDGGTVSVVGGSLTVTGGIAVGNTNLAGNLTMSSGTLTTDALTIGNGASLSGTFALSGGTADIGNLTISSNGTFTVTNSPAINVTGNWTDNGTYTKATETVTFDGTGAQAINGTVASQSFNNVIINSTPGQTVTVSGSTTTLTVNNLTETTGNFTAPATLNINGNLTLTAGTFTAGANTNDAGNWTNNGGTFTPGTGTVTFTGTSSSITGTAGSQTFYNVVESQTAGQTLSVTGSTTSLTTNNLTETTGNFTAPASLNINGALTLTAGTFTAGANISIAGNWSDATGAIFTPGTGTVTFTGASSAINGTITSQTFYNVIENKTAGQTLTTAGSMTSLTMNSFTETTGNFTATSLTTTTISGAVALSAGTYTAGTSTLVAGNWSNSGGAFSPAGGTVTFNGGSAQTISGSTVTTFNNLTLSNSNGLSLSGIDATINTTLAFTSGKITTGANNIIMSSTSATSISGAGAGKYINGNLRKGIANSNGATQTFEIGDASNYTPINLSFTGTVSGSGNLTAFTLPINEPNIATSTIDETNNVNRYWSLTNSGVAGFTNYSITLNFVAGDVDAGANTAIFIVGKDNGGWLNPYPTVGTKTSTSTQATGITLASGFGNFAVGQGGAGVPTMNTQPSNQTACTASTATITTSANSVPASTVQWLINTGSGFTNLTIASPYSVSTSSASGVTTSTLTINPTNTSLSAYQYEATFTNTKGNVTSGAATLTVNPVIANNTVNSAQEICTGSTPSPLTGALPTGGNGTFAYLWQSSITNGTSGFSNASGTDNGQNYTPSSLTQTTWYNRTVTSGGCSSTATAIQITVDGVATVTPGAALNTCQSSSPTPVTLTGASVGGTATTGAWSINSGGGILSSTSQTSNPAAVTYTPAAGYSGAVTLTLTTNAPGACPAVSNTRTINVNAIPVESINTNYCGTGGNVVLTANCSSGGCTGLSYLWSTGGTAQTLTVDEAGIYVVTVTNSNGCSTFNSTTVAVELTTNGNFESGNTGFTTQYDYHPGLYNYTTMSDTTGLYPEGRYAVGTNAHNYHPVFYGTDHTTGSGNFMIVNGNTSANGGAITVWQETVTINPNTAYYFSAWALSMDAVTPFAQLQFNVNGSQIGTVADLIANNNTSAPFGWTRFYGTWTSGPTDNSAVISIVDLQTSAGGNDFGLDDISCSTLAPITFSAAPSGNSGTPICVGNTISLAANVTGGATPFTYSWSGPNSFTSTQQNPSISNATSLNTGTYNLTVSDGYGCSITTSVSLTVNANPSVVVSGTTTGCVSPGVALGTTGSTAGSGSISSYQWSNSGGNISGATSSTYTATTIDNYTVLITNSNTCTASATKAITANANPVSVVSGTPNGCVSPGVALGTTGSSAGSGSISAYQWKNTSGNITGATNSTYTATASSNYSVVITNSNGCSTTSSASTVTANANPTAVISGSATGCVSPGVALGTTGSTAGSGSISSYQWSNSGGNISGATSSTYTATTIDNYTVLITNSNTCTASVTKAITANANPVSVISGTPTGCVNPGVALGTTGSSAGSGSISTYQWKNTSGNITGATNSTYTATASSNYTVVITNSNGCSTASSANAVTANANPVPVISGTTTGCVSPGVALGTTGSTSGSGSISSYQWSNSGGNISGATNSTYTATASSNYTVLITNSNTCTASVTKAVTANINPVATASSGTGADGAGTYCSYQTISLSSGPASMTSYSWSGPSSFSSSSQNPTRAASGDAGTYTVTVTDSHTCTSTATTTVTVNTPTVATAGNSGPFCSTGTISLSSGPNSMTSYSWSGVNTFTSTLQNPTRAASGNGGTYTVTITDGNSCTSSVSTGVTVDVTPSITTQPAGGTICLGSPINLSVTAGGTVLTYQWQKGVNNINGATNSTYSISNAGSTDAANYDVVIGNPACSSITSNTATITITSAETVPYLENFESNTGNNQLPNCLTATNFTSKTFTGSTAADAHSGSMYGYFGSSASDWFFTPGISLTAGIPYQFSFWYNTLNTSTFTTIGGYVGTEPATSSMTTSVGTLICHTCFPGTGTYYQYTGVYTPTTTGVYYFGINGTTNPGSTSMFIDDIAVGLECDGTPIAGTASVSTNLVCAGSNANLSLSGYTTGLDGITFQWQSSPTGQGTWSNLSGATSTAYTATVNVSTDYRCIATCTLTSQSNTSNTVTVDANIPAGNPTSATASATAICNGEQSTTLTLNGGGGGTGQIIAWYTGSCGGTPAGTGNNLIVSPSSTTTYFGRYEVSTPCSASNCSSVKITVNPTPVATVSGVGTYCSYQTISLSSGPSGMASYGWSGPNSFTASTQNITLPASNNGGTYSVTVTNSFSCTSSTQTSVTVNIQPTVSVKPSTKTICSTDTIGLKASGAVTYTWTPNSQLSIITVQGDSANVYPSVNTTYTVTGTDANQCTSSATSGFTVKPVPVVTVDPALSICTGAANVTLTAGGAVTYTWAPVGFLNATTGSIVNAQISELTFYTVTGTGSNGCTADAVVPVATVPSGGSVTPVNNVICPGGNRKLTVTGAAGNSYQWQISTDNVVWNNISGATNTTYTTAGSDGDTRKYYRLLATSNSCYDISSTTAIVDISITPTVTVTNVTSTTATVTWTPYGSGQYNMSWSGGAGSGSASALTSNSFVIGLSPTTPLIPNKDLLVTVTPVTPVCTGVTPSSASTHTLCASPVITNVSATAFHGFVVDWLAVPGATAYRVYYRDLSNSSSWSFVDVGNVTSATITTNAATYAVYVAAKNCPSTGNIGDASTPINYVTTLPLPPCSPPPTVSTVSNCPNQITVSISGSGPPYNLILRRISPSLTNGVSYPISTSAVNVTVGTQYAGSTWEIFATQVCGPGNISATSNISDVTVKPGCPIVNNLVLSHPTCNGFTASWNSSDCAGLGISKYELLIKRSNELNYAGYPVSSQLNYEAVSWEPGNTTYNVVVMAVACNDASSGYSNEQTISSLNCGREGIAEDANSNAVGDTKESVTVYPNPAQGQFYLDIGRIDMGEAGVKIELVNELGQAVETNISQISGGHLSQLISTPEGLATGIYFVRTSVGSNVYVNRIMITRE